MAAFQQTLPFVSDLEMASPLSNYSSREDF